MSDGLDRLLRWILGNLNEVIWIVVLFGGILLPVFKRIAQARRREGEERQRPLETPPTPPSRPAAGGPSRFDWEKWFEETIHGAAPETEEEEREEVVPPRAAAEPEPGPVWQRAPLSRERALTEQRPYDELAEPLTMQRREAPAPLTAMSGEGAITPLTEMPAYDSGMLPEGVGTLGERGFPSLEEGYRPSLEAMKPEVLEGAQISSLAAESAYAIAPTPDSRRPITDWRRALVLGEVLGRPLALRAGDPAGLSPPGL